MKKMMVMAAILVAVTSGCMVAGNKFEKNYFPVSPCPTPAVQIGDIKAEAEARVGNTEARIGDIKIINNVQPAVVQPQQLVPAEIKKPKPVVTPATVSPTPKKLKEVKNKTPQIIETAKSVIDSSVEAKESGVAFAILCPGKVERIEVKIKKQTEGE